MDEEVPLCAASIWFPTPPRATRRSLLQLMILHKLKRCSPETKAVSSHPSERAHHWTSSYWNRPNLVFLFSQPWWHMAARKLHNQCEGTKGPEDQLITENHSLSISPDFWLSICFMHWGRRGSIYCTCDYLHNHLPWLHQRKDIDLQWCR